MKNRPYFPNWEKQSNYPYVTMKSAQLCWLRHKFPPEAWTRLKCVLYIKDISYKPPCRVFSPRRPSQELREAGEIDVMKLLHGVEPKDYEKVLRKAGVYDFRAILKHLKMMQKQMEIDEEPEFTVSIAQLMYAFCQTENKLIRTWTQYYFGPNVWLCFTLESYALGT